MFGWQQNGASDGAANNKPTENAMTLPRDLSLDATGAILQRFIPELQRLRIPGDHWHAQSYRFPSGGVAAAQMLPAPALGQQLEIQASIRYGALSSKFGLLVLAGPTERTEVGFHISSGQVYVDRRLSSAGLHDTDVRAGPWLGAAARGGDVSLHMYVDHSIVTLIVDNRTAFSVWVHPQSNSSTNVGLFASSEDVVA